MASIARLNQHVAALLGKRERYIYMYGLYCVPENYSGRADSLCVCRKRERERDTVKGFNLGIAFSGIFGVRKRVLLLRG